MKRSNASIVANPKRRSLILHHHELLNDPDVVAFLDNTHKPFYEGLMSQLIQANEPALMLELIWVTQRNAVTLRNSDILEATVALPDGMLEYLLQNIDQVPCITSLTVQVAMLSPACCALLQTVLSDPTCTLTSLTFMNCSFADAQVQFPLHATTIHTLEWIETVVQGAAAPMDQMLSALPSWSGLEILRLVKREEPLNFAVITQLLVHNPRINLLYLMCHTAPAAPGDPAYQPQQDPALLLNLLRNDQTPLKRLTLHVMDAHNDAFNQHFLQCLSQCLATNTTLESLEVPGIQMCAQAVQDQFNASLNINHSLIALGPLEAFNDQVPPAARRNQRQRWWFTQDFVLGAAEAFLSLIALPKDLKTLVAGPLASTPAERACSGPLMALICKSTHQSAVKLRSAGLKEAALIYIRTNDRPRCRELLDALLQHPQLNLLPDDKRQVIEYARMRSRLNFLPPGYAQ
ncbi:hypothetical protein ASE11_23180 [Hydrogenophaga sp. Root209]|uniref:hypothetical protein n=1 Tax=Hydrogenophaga sp. Root209 TaxID=1736490 RepID=UPI0006F39824|nr:hypothetical protein [Hydrogenophaga sp. Root209]KRC08665.1 hypothetical protein ASE11_23180 [Hydrogenophaga sp. Root209]